MDTTEHIEISEIKPSNTHCPICNTPLGGRFTKKMKLADGVICPSCFGRMVSMRIGYSEALVNKAAGMATQDFLHYVEDRVEEIKRIEEFQATLSPCMQVQFDDNSRTMILCSIPQKKFIPRNYSLFSYDQIVDFELLENGGSIASGGVGRAITGGILFGGAGAVVGAATRSSKATCNQLLVKLTLKDYIKPSFYVYLIINTEVKKNSPTYAACMKIGQDILSKFMLITKEIEEEASDSQAGSTTVDVSDEIRKYKALFDDGIITEEEFRAKKKQLLGL